MMGALEHGYRIIRFVPLSAMINKHMIILYYSSPSILQPLVLRPPLIIKLLDLLPKGNLFSVLNDFYFKTTCNIRPHLLGPMSGLKIEGPLYTVLISSHFYA